MSVPSWARVGAKVVCVPTQIEGVQVANGAQLKRNGIYTIRGIVEIEYAVGIYLSEVVNIVQMTNHGMMEQAYHVGCFRPLVSRTQEQDVRAIKSMLRELPAETRLDRLLELLE